MKKLKVKLDGRVVTFTQSKDKWFEYINKGNYGYAIDPDKTICITSPWYADEYCPAPKHRFEIISEE